MFTHLNVFHILSFLCIPAGAVLAILVLTRTRSLLPLGMLVLAPTVIGASGTLSGFRQIEQVRAIPGVTVTPQEVTAARSVAPENVYFGLLCSALATGAIAGVRKQVASNRIVGFDPTPPMATPVVNDSSRSSDGRSPPANARHRRMV